MPFVLDCHLQFKGHWEEDLSSLHRRWLRSTKDSAADVLQVEEKEKAEDGLHQHHLPSKREAKATRKATAAGPAEDAEDRGQGSGSPIHEHIKQPEGHRKGEAEVDGQDAAAEPGGQVEERRGEVEEEEGGVEDWPDEESVDEDVGRVAVIRSVEGEVLLQIEHLAGHGRKAREVMADGHDVVVVREEEDEGKANGLGGVL